MTRGCFSLSNIRFEVGGAFGHKTGSMNIKFLLPLCLSASFVLAQDSTLAPLPADGFVTL